MITWQHTETEPQARYREALRQAADGSWAQAAPEEREHTLRTLLVMTAQVGRLSWDPPPRPTPEAPPAWGHYSASMWPDGDRNAVASALLRTPMLLLPNEPFRVGSVRTVDGDPAQRSPAGMTLETGLPALVLVAAVTAAAVAQIAIAYLGSEVIDRHLERREDSKRLLQAQSGSLEAVMAHLKLEHETGQQMPFRDEELRHLKALEEVQQKIAGKERREMPNPFPGAKLFDGSWLQAASVIPGGIGLVAVVAGVYLVTQK